VVIMSRETSEWLNNNVLVGFTSMRGNAWHYRETDQGEESNHYSGAIPVADVVRRLFHWEPVSCTMGYDVTALLGSDAQVWKPSAQGRQVIVRSDTLAELGVFKDSYEIHPYRSWLVEKVHEINNQLEIGQAGLLRGGAQAWVSFEVPENFSTAAGVDFRPQLIATTSCDGSLSTTYKRVSTIVVCDNTLSLAMSERHGQVLKVRHSRHSQKMLKAKMTDALELVSAEVEQVTTQIQQLSEWTVTDAEWSKFLDAYVPVPQDKGRGRTVAEAKRERLTAMYNNDIRVSPWRGTALGVLQAGNTWFHHEQTVRSAGHRAERNMTNVLDGRTEKHDTEVLALLAKVTG
jgi:phage/plasmid-like protein (TIGR03299 family)